MNRALVRIFRIEMIKKMLQLKDNTLIASRLVNILFKNYLPIQIAIQANLN